MGNWGHIMIRSVLFCYVSVISVKELKMNAMELYSEAIINISNCVHW